MRKIIIYSLCIICFVAILPASESYAADMSYSVKANLPENQQDKEHTYFDLLMEPKQQQTISITFENQSDDPIELEVNWNSAQTNDNGVIDYKGTRERKDNSLEYELKKLITGEHSIKLDSKEKREVPYTINMPEKKYDGILLGGFHIHKKNKDSGNKQKVQIKNDYSYVIGIQLRETEKQVAPELKLNTVEPGLNNYRTTLYANLQNTSSTMIKDMTVTAEVYKEKSAEVLHKTVKNNQSMAPNSNYNFPISWDNQSFQPGKYSLKLNAVDKVGHKWSFNKDFEIKDNAKKYNKEAVEINERVNKNDYIIYTLIFILTLAVGIIAYLLINLKKNVK
ncbi:DUF916 and DUF3324 domain-containing protein [Enterococcus faecalis]|uniref:DUF916 and DUF3324 domain-containing protein n=1 Tax=Enterococcus faecalis TaxID=1351 RepID=UPI001C5BBD3C|nr:DUF916 and DUF3324 domain-containing protein [Enterococcus faecalis]MBW4170068.1 DUF916 and DUF3324 domain-containing protein [Enterococcus faecalis]MBW4175251.1 DUF916 and DUF3324 domain-containing protein [Enterococcus faecalis]MBW4177525.1 DUF916 and DUF3324 domain-containing protein [Enterococcus faecalis]MCD5000829.1 DUF916 and DUF3324 domain-containing protein [Enterococcus faecalis]MCD5269313.1 DUF916 and DUF3324 domain-containing protein [Enterococcus faecalis]